MENIQQPSTGEIYKAHYQLEQLALKQNWAFGDKARRRDARDTARAVLKLAGESRVNQVLDDTQNRLASYTETIQGEA